MSKLGRSLTLWWSGGGSRAIIFSVQVAYILILFWIADWYLRSPEHPGVPTSFGSIPVGVPWFGALGAVLISMTGVFQHAHDWDPSYKFWHWSRPIVGAAIAVVAVLMFQAGVLSVTSPQSQQPTPAASETVTPNTTQGTGPATSNAAPPSIPPQRLQGQPILYYIIAFLVAYREETFRELIKRATDVILTPETPPIPPAAVAIAPSSGGIAGGTPVIITGTGLVGTTRVMFGATPAFFKIESDSQLTAMSPPVPSSVRVPVVVSGRGGNSTAGQFIYV